MIVIIIYTLVLKPKSGISDMAITWWSTQQFLRATTPTDPVSTLSTLISVAKIFSALIQTINYGNFNRENLRLILIEMNHFHHHYIYKDSVIQIKELFSNRYFHHFSRTKMIIAKNPGHGYFSLQKYQYGKNPFDKNFLTVKLINIFVIEHTVFLSI